MRNVNSESFRSRERMTSWIVKKKYEKVKISYFEVFKMIQENFAERWISAVTYYYSHNELEKQIHLI